MLASPHWRRRGPDAVTVLESRNYYWYSTQGTWSRIGLRKPFPLSAGKNLVIDIEVRGAVFLSPSFSTSQTALGSFREADKLPRLSALNWKTRPPSRGVQSSVGLKIELSARLSALGRFGRGCKGNGQSFPFLCLSGEASPGGTVVASLGGGIPEPLPLPVIPALRDQRIYTQFLQIELRPGSGFAPPTTAAS